MTTPGYKKCTLCGEEMIIDAILCPHCGKIPGRGKPPPRPAAEPGRGRARLFAGIVLGVGSLALITAGLARSDATLVLAGAVALALGLLRLLVAAR